ncbi:zinc finger protein 568-like [Protopterus annectens]|uniref:zinc finger protein 568-like n=1 Tax=Protopterus annectens TaxID=7888 RepID=UPI001CF9A097|nr:zinc finger protein 568-like [Protopterus annectens]
MCPMGSTDKTPHKVCGSSHSVTRRYKYMEHNSDFSLEKDLKVLLETQEIERMYKADECKTVSTFHFQKHWKDYIDEKLRRGDHPLDVDKCSRIFEGSKMKEKCKDSLKTHQKANAKGKLFQCATCGKCFIRMSSLIQHKKVHAGISPFKCAKCNKCFSHKFSLTIHKRTHTGERPYKCVTCDKAFTKKSSLTAHEQIHTGIKPFKCVTCGKRFLDKPKLQRHINSHTGVKPYKCAICNKILDRKLPLQFMRESTLELGPINVPHVARASYRRMAL